MQEHKTDPISTDAAIHFMRGAAASVYVMATSHGDVRVAMTVSSVVSVTMAPPTLLCCINKKASLWGVLEENKLGSLVSVSLLMQNQQHIADVCAQNVEGEEKFANASWSQFESIPYPTKALATLILRTDKFIPCGSHMMVLGHPVWSHFSKEYEQMLQTTETLGLVYSMGQYGTFSPST